MKTTPDKLFNYVTSVVDDASFKKLNADIETNEDVLSKEGVHY